MKQIALKEDMKDLILDVAERLIGRYGYKKTTMDDLAKEAGIGKGTIYLYFPSKEEVVFSVVERINTRLREKLRCIARSNASAPERLRKMIILRVLHRFDSVQEFSQSLDELFLALRPQFLARRGGWGDSEAQIFAEVLIEGRLLGVFEVDDAIETARNLQLATTALLPYSLSVKELGDRDTVKQKASAIAHLMLNGLLRRTEMEPPS